MFVSCILLKYANVLTGVTVNYAHLQTFVYVLFRLTSLL